MNRSQIIQIIQNAKRRVSELEDAVRTCPPELRDRYEDELWDTRLVLEYWENGGDEWNSRAWWSLSNLGARIRQKKKRLEED